MSAAVEAGAAAVRRTDAVPDRVALSAFGGAIVATGVYVGAARRG